MHMKGMSRATLPEVHYSRYAAGMHRLVHTQLHALLHQKRAIDNSIQRITCQSTQSGDIDAMESEEAGMVTYIQEGDIVRQPNGYRVFMMDGCKFLVRETGSGMLDLTDVFVVEDTTEIAARPTVVGEMPSIPGLFQDAEWYSYFPGNVIEDKEPITWVLKVYLIAVKTVNPYELDFENVFVLDSSDASVSRCLVERLAPDDTPRELLRIRIRETGITIDSEDGLPDPERVVKSKIAGVPAPSKLEMERQRYAQDSDEIGNIVTAEGKDALAESASSRESSEDEERQEVEVQEDVFDDDTLNDFLVEVDDDSDSEYDEYDASPDY